MSLVDELKRRNVFKVSAAYLALGWIVTQVTGAVVPALNLPAVINSIVVWIGLAGFPFVVMFAGIHADPRWLAFLRENGLAPEQVAAISFDIKLPE